VADKKVERGAGPAMHDDQNRPCAERVTGTNISETLCMVCAYEEDISISARMESV